MSSSTNTTREFYFTSDGLYVNITSSNYFLPNYVTYLSLTNSFFFLSCYAIFYLCFAIMLFILQKRKIPIKKNPKILFTTVGIFVGIQCANLLIRIMYESWTWNAKNLYDSGQTLFRVEYFFGWKVLASLTTCSLFWNYVFVFVILFFVQLMFWKTAWSLRAISKQFYHFFRILNIVIFSLFITLMTLIVIVIPFIEYSAELYLVDSKTRTNVYYGLFSALVTMFLFDSFTTVLSAISIVKGIRKNSSKFRSSGSSSSFISLSRNNPFIVTLGLMIGLILCILCQILAAAIASSVGSGKSGLKIIWHFFTCLAVLIFAVLSLLLFYPMFIQTEKVLLKLNELDSGRRRSTTIQSPVIPHVQTKSNETNTQSTPEIQSQNSPEQVNPSIILTFNDPTPQSSPTTSQIPKNSSTIALIDTSAYATTTSEPITPLSTPPLMMMTSPSSISMNSPSPPTTMNNSDVPSSYV
ncbi:hypothetical protein C9374_007817 [Naegleria lovaniensis]|uniref:Uncharacterized protein n=1 Tax=Naegleria lovaniensis TaxID=51637 RepID=A0AA88GFY8_NAELO|nr:uncharacterized protein C9374_007817 [Naegleria lovaniensis]KAG2378669.1 hypothetical protein C9374_007817 [Naegleria lovaniensis]